MMPKYQNDDVDVRVVSGIRSFIEELTCWGRRVEPLPRNSLSYDYGGRR
jgi:hypothetical protein